MKTAFLLALLGLAPLSQVLPAPNPSDSGDFANKGKKDGGKKDEEDEEDVKVARTRQDLSGPGRLARRA